MRILWRKTERKCEWNE